MMKQRSLAPRQFVLVRALSVAMAFWLVPVRSTIGAFPDGHDPQRLASALLAGMRDQRERLRQGLVRGAGHMFKPYPSGTLEGPINFMYAFDYDQDLLHVERDDPRPTPDAGLTAGDVRRADIMDMPRALWHYAHIHKPDRAIHIIRMAESHNPSEIQINKPDFDIRREGVFDLRTVGLLGALSYERQASWNDIFRHLSESPADEVVDEGDGIWRIRWTTKDGIGRNNLWIDRKKGFSPVRFEFQHKAVNPIRGAPQDWPEPFQKCEATWTEANGVWVPLTYRIEDQQYRDKKGLPSEYEHEFRWEIVNQPVPAELFEIESLNAPKGTLVTDHRGQEIVLTSVLGEPDNPEVGTMYTRPQPGEPSRIVPRGYRNGTWLFLGANALAVLLIVLLYRFRRPRKAGN